MSTTLRKLLRLFSDGEYYGFEHREDTQRIDAWIEMDFGWDPVATVGLMAAFGSGVGWTGAAYVSVAEQSVLLTDNETNYVQRTVEGVISANTGGFTPSTHLPVCQLVTNAGEVSTYVDHRAAARALILGLAPLASPGFTGIPTAPTAALGTDTTQIATTGFVQAAIAALRNGVAAAFDTLAEIATELGLMAPLASPIFTGDPTVPDDAYGAGWDGNLGIPTKNALYDKIEAVASGATITVRKDGGANIGSRGRFNFITGANITLTIADDAVDGEIDITIEATGGGGGGSAGGLDVPFHFGNT